MFVYCYSYGFVPMFVCLSCWLLSLYSCCTFIYIAFVLSGWCFTLMPFYRTLLYSIVLRSMLIYFTLLYPSWFHFNALYPILYGQSLHFISLRSHFLSFTTPFIPCHFILFYFNTFHDIIWMQASFSKPTVWWRRPPRGEEWHPFRDWLSTLSHKLNGRAIHHWRGMISNSSDMVCSGMIRNLHSEVFSWDPQLGI